MAKKTSAAPKEEVTEFEDTTVEEQPVQAEEPVAPKAAPVSEISISVNDAEKLIELHRKIAKADEHFKTCQSVNFREFVQGVYKAQTTVDAVNRLKEAVEKAKKGE